MSPRLPSLHPKKLPRRSLDETYVNVVIWAAEVRCQVAAKTTHRISWHGSREQQVKTERRKLPECQLGLYMRLHTPWNMCSMCPISCWAALFYCSVINPEICPNCHIFHCSDAYSNAAFSLCIKCFWSDWHKSDKALPRTLGHWHMSNVLNNTNNSSAHSVNAIITAAQGINRFHYVQMPCPHYHFNSAQQQELSADILKGSTVPVWCFDILINKASCFHTCMSLLL